MSEGMHSNHVTAGKRSRGRLAMIVAGTALALVAGGVSIQWLRAKPGAAAENEEGTARTGAAAARNATAAATSGQNQVLATVGKTSITREQVAAECMERYGLEVLDKMVNRTIIEEACRDRGVEVSQKEVGQEIIEIAKKFNLDSKQWLQMLKAERNITPEQYARDIIWPMLALKKLAGAEVTVSEEDLQKAFVRDYGPRVECRMIMCDNLRRAQDVWNKAKANPDEFGRLAREHSVEPTSRALDGDVPPIRRYSGNEQLEKAAFTLKEGEVSGIVEVGPPTAKRYVILQCKGRTAQVVKSLDEVRTELFKQLKEEKTQEAVAKVFEQIKDEVRVNNYVNNTVSGGDTGSAGVRQTSATSSRSEAPRTSSGARTQPR